MIRFFVESKEIHFALVDALHEGYRYFLHIADHFRGFVETIDDLVDYCVSLRSSDFDVVVPR